MWLISLLLVLMALATHLPACCAWLHSLPRYSEQKLPIGNTLPPHITA
jgi:hypothetical protein